MQKPKIFIASDHAGFELKNDFIKYLKEQGFEVLDYGNAIYDPKDDYTDFVVPMALNMQKEQDTSTKGIVICRNGVGVGLAVNKFKGLRAGTCFNMRHVVSARNDDDINVVAIPADYVSKDEAFAILHQFLETPFSQEERHIKRLAKIKDLGS